MVEKKQKVKLKAADLVKGAVITPLPSEEGGRGSCPRMRDFHHTEMHLQRILLQPAREKFKESENAAQGTRKQNYLKIFPGGEDQVAS